MSLVADEIINVENTKKTAKYLLKVTAKFSENTGYEVNTKINSFSGVSENACRSTTLKISSIKATRTKKLAQIVRINIFRLWKLTLKKEAES